MNRYQLAPRVFVAATEEGAVLLDLERDDYLGLDADQSRAMADVVEGWVSVDAASVPVSPSDADALAKELCERGVLIEAAPEGAVHTSGLPRAHDTQVAISEFLPWEHTRTSRVRFSQVLMFVACLLQTLLLIRVLRFARIVSRVENRKKRRASITPQPSGSALKQAVGAYFHVRPFFFGAKSRCLLDSLTLIEFLAHYRLYPDWVIGVQINPFGSHSWVQHGAFVINGTPSVVRAYSPILVV